MTDRVSGLTVILDKDVREDDVDGLAQAIGHMRGVIKVTKETAAPFPESVARARLAEDLAGRFRAILDDLWRV
jgi:hypothetical protein